MLRQVEEVFQRTAYRLQIITLRSSTGIVQTIQTTAEHPVYALQQGWVAAGKFQPGDLIRQRDGGVSTVISSRREEHPEGIIVYNFQVAGNHTYFVRAEGSQAEPVWVHNYDPNDVPRTQREALLEENGMQEIEPSNQGMNNPVVREAVEFGTDTHQKFKAALIEQTGTSADDWRLNTAPGQKGVDARYIGDPARNPGFDYAELKPNSSSGIDTFDEQLKNWNLPVGRTQLWLSWQERRHLFHRYQLLKEIALVSVDPFSLMRSGQPADAIRQLQGMYAQNPSPSHTMALGVGYLWLGEYDVAWEHFQHANRKPRNSTDIYFGMAGAAKWCLGKSDDAIREWQSGLQAQYADFAGGIGIPLLLFLASTHSAGSLFNNRCGSDR